MPQALVRAEYAGVPDGPLPSIGGRPWYLSSSKDNPAVVRGALGPPARHVPGDAPGGSAAGYAQIELPGPCRRVGGMLRWDASPPGSSSVALGAFDTIGFKAESSSSPLHLDISPTGCELAVFSGSYDDFTELVPETGGDSFQTFATPMVCDGRTTYRVECTIDPTGAATVTVGDVFSGVYRDPRIASIRAAYPFWEYYTKRGEANVGRFTAIWADLA